MLVSCAHAMRANQRGSKVQSALQHSAEAAKALHYARLLLRHKPALASWMRLWVPCAAHKIFRLAHAGCRDKLRRRRAAGSNGLRNAHLMQPKIGKGVRGGAGMEDSASAE